MPRARPRAALPRAALLATVLALGLPPSVAAHVDLLSSSPQTGENLASPPEEVVLIFDGELDPAGSSFTVTDSHGMEVGSGDVDLTVADRNRLSGAVAITEAGMYTVSWVVLGLDGHEVDGSFTFGFEAEAPLPQPPDTAMAPQPPAATVTAGVLLLVAALAAGIRHYRRRQILPTIALAVGLVLAACVPQAAVPETCDDPSVTLETTLVEERLEPADLEVCQGQEVTIVIDIQRDGTLHLHGYDEELPAREVHSGATALFAFTAVRSGQFPIALHTHDGPAEVTAGTLTVHER